MSDPDRLLESTDSEVERMLLRAGRESAPRAAQERALLVATALVTAPTVGAGRPTVSTAAGKAAAGAKTASLVSLKWVTVIGLASLGAVSGTMAVRAVHGSSSVESANAANSAKDATKPVASTVARPVGITPGGPSPDSLGSLTPTPDPVGRPKAAAPISPTPGPGPTQPMPSRTETITPFGSTAAEVTFLDGARRAIGDGDPPTALSILDDYTRRFPHGILAPEGSVLRIEALVEAGDRPAAIRAAQSFLQANPASPYAQRIESLLGIPNP